MRDRSSVRSGSAGSQTRSDSCPQAVAECRVRIDRRRPTAMSVHGARGARERILDFAASGLVEAVTGQPVEAPAGGPWAWRQLGPSLAVDEPDERSALPPTRSKLIWPSRSRYASTSKQLEPGFGIRVTGLPRRGGAALSADLSPQVEVQAPQGRGRQGHSRIAARRPPAPR